MHAASRRTALILGMALLIAGCDRNAPSEADTQRIAELHARLQKLQADVTLARDVSAIKKLQRAYGYYLDKAMADDMGDLFTRDARAEYSVSGQLIGQDSIRRAFRFSGPNNRLVDGRMNTHTQLQGVVHVAPRQGEGTERNGLHVGDHETGKTAKARWRILALTANYGERASWGEGPYEVEYAKEDGVWKISKLQWYVTVTGALYDGGWTKKRPPIPRRPGAIPPPDARSTVPDLKPYPEVYMPPYHYKNPVSGK